MIIPSKGMYYLRKLGEGSQTGFVDTDDRVEGSLWSLGTLFGPSR